MAAHNRRGFTIVELLVVITIIGILMALLFPAINIARERARLAQCVTNQQQVGKAVQTKTMTANDVFPKHLKLDPSGTYNWPWVVRVLPEMGRGDLFDVINATAAGADITGRTERIDILFCPSDPPVNPAALQINYVANSGIDGLDDPPGNGIFNQTKDVTLSYVAQNDGASTTLMLSENVDATFWNAQGKMPDEVYQTALIWQNPAPSGFGLNEGIGGDPATNGKNLARPSSKHSGGFVVTFCDGHARYLSQQIGYDVYKRLMTSAGQKLTPAEVPLAEQDLDK